MVFVLAFFVGGVLCAIGQLVLDLSHHRVTPAHLLVGFISAGALLSSVGFYQPLVKWAGAGALIPLSGLGHMMTESAFNAVDRDNLLGAFIGPLEATAATLTAALVFGLFTAVFVKPRG